MNIILVLHYMYLVTAVRQKKFSSSTRLQMEKLVQNNQMITVQSIYEIIFTSAIFSFI